MKLGLLFMNDDIPIALLEAKVSNSTIIDTEYIQKSTLSIKNLQLLQQSLYRLIKYIEKNNNHHYSSDTESQPLNRDNSFIRKLDNVLSDHLVDDVFPIDKLSAELCMSRSCLYRKIKVISGMSPNKYIKAIKMNRAIELLQQGHRIVEVSVQLGFSSPSYFAKCFKKQFGISPRDILQ